MKKYLYLLLLPLIVSCNCPDDMRVEYCDANITTFLTFIKFKDPNVRNCIIAETIDGDTAQMRGMPGVCQELILGGNPYIEFIQDYYIVDWKWGRFLYKPTNVILDMPWTELSDWRTQWQLNETNTLPKSKIEEYGVISWAQIDKLLGTNDTTVSVCYNPQYSFPSIYCRFVSISEINNFSENDNQYEYKSMVIRQDSLQDVYIERFKNVIMSGINYRKYAGYIIK